MSKRVLLPFWLWPYSWGLKGQAREIAKLEYELEGIELEKAKAKVIHTGLELDRANNEINFKYKKIDNFTYDSNKILLSEDKDKAIQMLNHHHINGNIDDYEFEKQKATLTIKNKEKLEKELNDIEFKYKKISEYEYKVANAAYITDDTKRLIALLEAEYLIKHITEREYRKQKATLEGVSYVDVVKLDIDLKNPKNGAFELDWNDVFIEELEAAGYVYPQPEQAVNAWWNEVCRNIALEEFDGVGDFTERVGGVNQNKIPLGDNRWAKK